MNDHDVDRTAAEGFAALDGAQDRAQDGAPAAGGARPLLRRSARPALAVLDVLIALGAGSLVVLVHDVHFLLYAPYWLDESWVADSIRAPLGQVPRLSASTPLGWTMLLRLVPLPTHSLQRQRLIPLAFAALAVAAAYLLGRELRLNRFTAGLLAAAAALLSPAMLLRNDLKQYTAEAFAAIVIWLLVARAETRWSRWRLAAIAVVASLGTLFAETAVFTGAAALGCLALVALARRQWKRLAEVAVAAAGALAVFGAIYAVLLRPRVNQALVSIWDPDYAPRSVTGAAAFFWAKLTVLGPALGFPPQPAAPALAATAQAVTRSTTQLGVSTLSAINTASGAAATAAPPGVTPGFILALALAAAGVVALAALRRPALAAMLPVTLILVMAASVARIYPFGDERTSTFWLVMFPVLMAIAVAAAAHAAGLCLRRAHPWARRIGQPAIAVVAAAAAIGFYAHAVMPDVNDHDIAHDDTRSQVQYMEDHWRAGDVAIVDYGASYAFAYYYATPPIAYPYLAGDAAEFIPTYPGRPIITMTARDPGAVDAALAQARALLAREPAGTRGRIWVIREHMLTPEADAWRKDFIALDHGPGHVDILALNTLGYSPGYQPLALFVPTGG